MAFQTPNFCAKFCALTEPVHVFFLTWAQIIFSYLACFFISSKEFSRFHPQIQPMLDGIINNRKEWNAKKEEYEAKLKAIEDAKAAKEAAAQAKGSVLL